MTTRYLYETGVGLRYYMEGVIIYECETGEPTFYVSGPTVFAYGSRTPAYWIDGNDLQPYDKTKAKLYFNFNIET